MTPGPLDDSDRKLESDLRAVARARSRGLAGHPSAEELADYHLGLLAPGEADPIEEHLAFCPDCARLVLDLAAFSLPAASPEPAARPGLDGEWRRLEARLERESAPALPRTPFRGRFPWTLAASLLFLLGLLLLGWNLALRRELARARSPRAELTLADLVPQGEGTERAAEAPARVQVPSRRGGVVLLLNLGDLRSFPRYSLELVSARGEALWTSPDVPRGSDGTFLLEVPAEMLAPGTYEVRIRGRRDGREEPLARYSFEAVRGTPPARDR